MQKFSSNIVIQIKQTFPLSNIVQNYVALNNRFYGLCPFHSEKSPSFHVSDNKGLWHCFGCYRGGDVFDFIQEIEDLSFPQAVEFLAKEAGILVAQPKSERFKSYKSRRLITRNERLSILSKFEDAFTEYERCMSDCLLFERRCLPYDKKVWDSMDYLEEQLLDNRFEKFNELQKQREEVFAKLRREA